jgi:hypothetical protein
MEVKQIASQVTMEALLDGHLNKRDSVKVQRDRRRRITRLGVLGVTEEKKLGVVLEYVWRPA